MAEEHANVSLIKRFDPRDLSTAASLFAPDAVFHFFNPRLPDIQGDYVGLDAIKSFFENLGSTTKGSFQVQPISLTPVGEELVVMHTQNRMTIEDETIVTDVVLVWRVVGGRIAEVWDIPSVHTKAVPLDD
ncbi:MAG: nuclear transport factor 2 family protein [Pseudomonadota bacterium]